MKVIDSKILIRVKKGDAATERFGGFEVPVGAGEFEIGEVLSVGEKVVGLAEGDTIYFYKGSGKEFTHEGQKYRVITIPEVIVIL